MLLQEDLPGKTDMAVDTAGTVVALEAQEAAMAGEVVDLWALLLLLAIGDVVRGLVLTVEEAATEVAGAVTSGIRLFQSTTPPSGLPMNVHRVVV